MSGRDALLRRARTLLASGRVADAEALLQTEVRQRPRDAEPLELLAEFYREVGRPAVAAQVLARCIEVDPRCSSAYFSLAALLDELDRVPEVVDVYTRLVAVHPNLAVAHFNRAVFLRRADHLEDAVAAYRRALQLQVDGAAEAWSNIGVILGELERHDEARAAFEAALQLDGRWIPALYNLGLLHEEFGEREGALELFERVLTIDPNYHDALVRIASAQTVRTADDPVIERLRSSCRRSDLAPTAREALSFALGKALDDCGQFDEAFAAYRVGNRIARERGRPYDRGAAQRHVEAICDCFTAAWLKGVRPVSERPMVFVCGMFRSGTTLLEQMLASHPALTAGGEIAYFNQRLDPQTTGFPQATAAADAATLGALGQGYIDYLDQRFGGAPCVINKRPDTVEYLGLLRGLFPNARFIVTQRDALDTCLSIFFQQLGDRLSYATDIADSAHHLLGQRTLLRHWQTLFADQMLELKYEQLVADPEPTLRHACDFLALPWAADVLRVTGNAARVRTASVWQVREPLHQRAVGRSRRYMQHLGAAVKVLESAGNLEGVR